MARLSYEQFIAGIRTALGHADNDSSTAVLGITRAVLQFHVSELAKVLIERCGLAVQSGPMAGMKLIDSSSGALFIPRLLGCYESELHAIINRIAKSNYRRIVNIGCSEGYYAVGLARLMPSVRVFAFDIDEYARRMTAELAALNDVADRVTVAGECDHQQLQELATPGTLILCDIEGAELELMDMEKVPNLAHCDMLVECHDFIAEGTSQQISNRFRGTHEIMLIRNGGINPNEVPHVKSLRPIFKFVAVWEGRPGPTPWAFLQSRRTIGNSKQAQAQAFVARASDLLEQAAQDDILERYEFLLEDHFHRLDCARTNVPLWPCDVNLAPAPAIRRLVGPEGYRYFMFGLAEHFWLIRGVLGYRGDQQILDIGCGFGKTALALKELIHPPGGYIGFDIQPRLIEFSQSLLKQLGISDYFKTEYLPIVSSSYYTGKAAGDGIPADAFIFPYDENRFDCAVAFSVLTHLRTASLENYARNLSRVVRPGGKLLLSFYLLDNAPERDTGGAPWSDSERRRALKPSPDSADGDCLRVLKPNNPDYLVAYELDYLRDVFGKLGFLLEREPMYGSWSGRSDFYGHQDYLLFRRDSAPVG